MADESCSLRTPLIGNEFKLALSTTEPVKLDPPTLHVAGFCEVNPTFDIVPTLQLSPVAVSPTIGWTPAEIKIPFDILTLRVKPDLPPGPRVDIGETGEGLPPEGPPPANADGTPGKLPLPSFVKETPDGVIVKGVTVGGKGVKILGKTFEGDGGRPPTSIGLSVSPDPWKPSVSLHGSF